MKFIKDHKGEQLTTAQFINNIVRNPAEGKGMDIAEMRRRFRIIDVVEKGPVSGWFEFEDADWEVLKQVLKTTQFVTYHQDILDMGNLIEHAPSVVPTEAIT